MAHEDDCARCGAPVSMQVECIDGRRCSICGKRSGTATKMRITAVDVDKAHVIWCTGCKRYVMVVDDTKGSTDADSER